LLYNKVWMTGTRCHDKNSDHFNIRHAFLILTLHILYLMQRLTFPILSKDGLLRSQRQITDNNTSEQTQSMGPV